MKSTIAVLVNPAEIQDLNTPLESLHISQKDNKVHFERFPISEHAIKKYYNFLSPGGQAAFICFMQKDIDFQKSQIRKQRLRQKGGINADDYVRKVSLRQLNEALQALVPELQAVKSYHRVKNPETGNYRIAACSFSPLRPGLSFEVTYDEDKGSYHLCTVFTIGDKQYYEAEVQRNIFLLACDNCYYCLAHEDVLTLEWLEEKNPRQYSSNPTELSQKILLRLEEKYKVERNNLFRKNEIRVSPVHNVFLSEISDSFLMLLPRWDYEGFMAEGHFKACFETNKNGDLYSIYRNKEEEEQFIQFLRALHPNFQKQHNGYFYLSFSDAKKKQWFLKSYHYLLENNISVKGLDMLRHFRYSEHPVHTHMHIEQEENNKVILQLQVSFGKEQIKLQELRKLLIENQSTILLKDNTIGVFTEEWLQTYAVIIKHGQIVGNKIHVAKWVFIQVNTARQEQSPIPGEWYKKWLAWQQAETPLYPLAATVKATLRPYQQKGYEWMLLLSEIGAGACLADDMGLGKTLQTICFLARQSENTPGAKHIIITPASLLYSWKQELERFTPGIRCQVYNGAQRSLEAFNNNAADIIICSYGTLRSDIELLKIINWNTAVLDESHNIKNLHAQITGAVFQLKAASKIALSGTPVMNSTFDLYAQLQFLLPDFLGKPEFFKKEYVYPIDRDVDKDKINALQKLTAPYLLRRTKKEVAKDLPDRIESILWCEMGEAQKLVYEEVKNSIRDSLFLDIKTNGLAKNKLGILQGIQKLRQVCGAPQLLKDSEFTVTEAIKLDILAAEIQQLRNNKALVFSQFKGMLHLIAETLTKLNIPYYHFDGDTPAAKRIEMINAFQEEGNTTRVFLISLKAGNAGITLTAADYVFLVDPWWNTAVQQQAIDRTHRIGQDKTVFAYKLVCKDTIEEKIVRMQERKQLLSDELIAEEGFVKNLNEEDLAYLFA